ncbi:glutathione S-transferase N-terminal domain-containing protein [Mesorhizobium sp. LMG 17147]|uniref:glutathione S-transferase N-terminal domain-containing protein n=1 Tax=Mesorhizobium sp. LMG 17147 TaxID=2963091 RepID=UPI0034A113D6
MGLVAAFERLGQPYRLCRVDMLTEMKNDAYASINGRQETPVLITEESRVLTETMAIAAWLEARDTQRRISFDPRSPEAEDAPAGGFHKHRLHRRLHPALGGI